MSTILQHNYQMSIFAKILCSVLIPELHVNSSKLFHSLVSSMVTISRPLANCIN